MACSSSDVALNVATTVLRATGCALKDNPYSLRAESFNSMILKAIAATAATLALSGPALAGPYANFERNDGFAGSDHSAINELHIGIDGALGESVTGYAQIGPAIVQPSSGDSDTQFSGKAGASIAISETLSAYGEVSFLTSDSDTGYGVKSGLRYDF